MDYDLAEPVLAALRGAIDLSDCGYATPADVGETFAGFAAARHGWTVDPGRVHLVPDVMAGVDVILRLATEPGDGVVIKWLDALLAQLDHARTEFGRLLRQRLPEAGYVPPEASYLAWVDCSGLGLGPEPAEVFLDRGRVALGRGLDFGPPGDGYVRVTIGTSSALLAEIVDRMAAAAG
jgi:bifunctional pyridoxal-dependent enzyme with beta-cystathionase and maltose regulon repressor activities